MSCISWAQRLADALVSRGQVGGPSSAKAMTAGEDLLVSFQFRGFQRS